MEAAARVMDALAPNRAKYLDFVRARVGADAEDVLQLAFMRAALKAELLHDPERAQAWFYRILHHAIADHHAQRDRRAVPLDDDPPASDEPPSTGVCACATALLADLRPEYADMLRRVDVDEQPLAEVAEALGITANNATVRIHRARKSLRDELVRRCGTTSMRACLDCSCDE